MTSIPIDRDDEVDHEILLRVLFAKVKCPVTLRLIRQWLRAPILIDGKLIKRRKGVPQGSPMSPLLSNIMLHELDKELEKRGNRYVVMLTTLVFTRRVRSSAKSGQQYIFVSQEQDEATHQS
ncbi:MAG TPA: reverse transcriptase domain-containing protein [Ohtaekwangia sp.]|nr:reverse transcriptase domain-containing protein [Ohtaekwangia sp.]